MQITFAKKCAWRAIYIRQGNRVIFSLGIDPAARAQVFGNVYRLRFRFNLWRARYWYKLDGRYQ